jgi:GWxTD domain-containing protein
VYLRHELIAASSPVPFVGRISFLAGPHADSALALLSISLASRSLTFSREGDRYRAGYDVIAELKSATGTRKVVDATESVRLLTYQETQRNDETVIFQRFFQVFPGTYELSLTLRDVVGGRTSAFQSGLTAPNPRVRGISSPVLVHEGETRDNLDSPPRLVASPRGTGVFGADSVLRAYVEAYSGIGGTNSIGYAIVNEGGTRIFGDSIILGSSSPVAGGFIRIPVTSVGIGVARLRVWRTSGSDTVQTPLFVGFGEELPVASFSDMLSYLRFYASGERLARMRSAAEEQKPGMWSAFLRETDSDPSTPQHEGLLQYFDRIRRANERFSGENIDGWLTDRGEVYVTLGEPDQLGALASADLTGRVRSFAWEYQQHSLRLIFTDRTGLGRWMLEPLSEAEFRSVALRERAGR